MLDGETNHNKVTTLVLLQPVLLLQSMSHKGRKYKEWLKSIRKGIGHMQLDVVAHGCMP